MEAVSMRPHLISWAAGRLGDVRFRAPASAGIGAPRIGARLPRVPSSCRD